MKQKLSLLVTCLALLCMIGCTSPNTGEKQSYAPIKVEVPERPAGQQDVIQLTTPKLETVRVGFIGLGMRGPGAVSRFTHIPGTQIVALCDLVPENVEKCQNILTKAGLPKAAAYTTTKRHGNNFANETTSTLYTLQPTGSTMLKWVFMLWSKAST